MFEFDVTIIAFLFVAAFIAGFIDSIAGGGGMITIPALLLTGMSPVEALATNKLQGTFGSFSAALHFYNKGYIEIKKTLPFLLLVFLGSALGTWLIQNLDPGFLAKMLPFLVLLFGIYFLFSPKVSEENQVKQVCIPLVFFLFACIGFYDGFFGPGTGSFFFLALIFLLGFGATKALAHAKLYNFSTNIASVLFFAIGGYILWFIGFFMAIAQFLGANLGARLAIKFGFRVIKPCIVGISFIMAAKLLYEQYWQ